MSDDNSITAAATSGELIPVPLVVSADLHLIVARYDDGKYWVHPDFRADDPGGNSPDMRAQLTEAWSLIRHAQLYFQPRDINVGWQAMAGKWLAANEAHRPEIRIKPEGAP